MAWRLDPSKGVRPRADRPAAKPLIGVLCCNEVAKRPIQAVASRFIDPLVRISGATVLLVPAVADSFDATSIALRLDGLLLTGSRSNIASARYGGCGGAGPLDEERDEVALALAAKMIELGRPVFGICRGLQELNVLFGGTLLDIEPGGHHHPAPDAVEFDELFLHRHEIELAEDGRLALSAQGQRISVNSVHCQGIDRLGAGLVVEAVATDDGLVEAFSSRPCGGEVMAVQWHPEWDADRCATSRAFFTLIGSALRSDLGRSGGAD